MVCGGRRRGFGFQRRSYISVGSEQRQGRKTHQFINSQLDEREWQRCSWEEQRKDDSFLFFTQSQILKLSEAAFLSPWTPNLTLSIAVIIIKAEKKKEAHADTHTQKHHNTLFMIHAFLAELTIIKITRINDDPVRLSPCQRLFNPDYGFVSDTVKWREHTPPLDTGNINLPLTGRLGSSLFVLHTYARAWTLKMLRRTICGIRNRE